MSPCGKIAYPNAPEAYRAARGVKQHHGPPQRAYRCTDCTAANDGRAVWHLTSELRHESDHTKPRQLRKAIARWRWRPQEIAADD